jgi:hypothetical protein
MLPQIPTDNLYKFLFIAGLTLAFASSVLYITKYSAIREELDAIELKLVNGKVAFLKDSLIMDLELERINELQNEDSSRIGDLEKLIRRNEKVKESELEQISLNLSERKKNIWDAKKNYIERYTSSRSRTKIILYRLDKQKEENRLLLFVGFFSAAVFLIGIRLAYYGYLKWYDKVQKPTDEKIKYELENLKASETSTNNPKGNSEDIGNNTIY